ncbi:subtilisin-like protease SBT4.3 isoform X2 [Carica papaya]|nr:subtilisin-like protease SBT4.3 isoform X2 [Carica papaya]
MDNVVAVFPSRSFQLQTTRSWDFLGFPTTIKRLPERESNLIVGVFDTGIWPESESFKDEGFGPPPRKWKGICQNITCNNKLIGARFYYTGDIALAEERSVLDINGHGTHTASTVAGMEVENANFFGLAKGTARGAVPSARIAAYKVCWKTITHDTCEEQDFLAAFEDAINDGVDMMSISIGSNETQPYVKDTLAIGAFRAMKRGILTSAAAGNFGPTPSTVTNGAPWILTVAASTIDRKLVAKVELGNGRTFMGNTINGFPTQESFFPIQLGEDGNHNHLIDNSTKGKNIFAHATLTVILADDVGAQGVIWSNDAFIFQSCPLPLPGACMSTRDGEQVKNYTEETKNPTGKIHQSIGIHDPKAPIVADFSSRGPVKISPDILKPDITAPGVDILAAYSLRANPTPFPNDKRHSPFNIISGTSMACPHATGVALYLKTFYPSWSPSAIKSALMTTASPISSKENPDAEFSYGSGHINPLKALNPGLVYMTEENDYINFLCNILSDEEVEAISGEKVNCLNSSTSAKDLNYPSMSVKVAPLKPFSVVFPRTVTNVGEANSTYTASIQSPSNYKLNISVEPNVLTFKSLDEKLGFKVKVSGGPLEVGDKISASVVWLDGKHSVRSPVFIYA